MGRLALDKRNFVIKSMLKVSSYKQRLIEFKEYFGTSISRVAIRKIAKKWNEASVIENQIHGRSGRPRDARSKENIALLRVAHHPCAARVNFSKLSWDVNFKLKYYLSIGVCFIALLFVVWIL